jgi:3-mercaptopyruvate sulfurtransferase SseA
LLQRAGISNDITLILYGDFNNWFAAFAFWVFKYYGYDDIRLMNGGRKKWLEEDRPLSKDIPEYPKGNFKAAEPDKSIRVFLNYVRDSDKEVITYCRIGERSSHTWFVLKYLLGYPDVKNYDGSWTEWGNMIDNPIEK